MHFIKRVLKSIKNGTFMYLVKRKLTKIFSKFLIKGKKIKNNKIMFIPFQGRYECNLKAICNEIIEKKLPYEIVWAAKEREYNNKDQFPKELKLVKFGTAKSYKELAESKFVIFNAIDIMNLNYKKKQDQIYIQTWHGSMGFKRLDTDNRPNWRDKVVKLGKDTNYIVTNSTFEEEVFRTSFWAQTEMYKVGHPRNDILFDKEKSKYFSKKIKELYNIPKNNKVLLYAPTFRDNLTTEYYDIDYERLAKNLEKRFGGKWTILLRLHYKLIYDIDSMKLPENVINVSDYKDMQELLSMVDIGITDYSSWMCDFVLTSKPGFIYAKDSKEYQRGFYYPLEETPFKVCKDNNELEKNILNFDTKDYEKGVKKFLKERGCYENGNATKKVIELIESINKN